MESGKSRRVVSVPGGRLPQTRASERRASTGGPSRTFTGIKVGAVARFRYGLGRAECVTKDACSVRRGATGDRGSRDLTAPVVYSTQQEDSELWFAPHTKPLPAPCSGNFCFLLIHDSPRPSCKTKVLYTCGPSLVYPDVWFCSKVGYGILSSTERNFSMLQRYS